jgi:hypothetical protein
LCYYEISGLFLNPKYIGKGLKARPYVCWIENKNCNRIKLACGFQYPNKLPKTIIAASPHQQPVEPVNLPPKRNVESQKNRVQNIWSPIGVRARPESLGPSSSRACRVERLDDLVLRHIDTRHILDLVKWGFVLRVALIHKIALMIR